MAERLREHCRALGASSECFAGCDIKQSEIDDERVFTPEEIAAERVVYDAWLARHNAPVELLKRLHDWDGFDTAADGAYWRKEILSVVAPIETPTADDVAWATKELREEATADPARLTDLESGKASGSATESSSSLRI